MSFSQALLEAIESLNGNKMRSGLTVLGIVIGVAAVIAMLAVGNGLETGTLRMFSGLATNSVGVFRGKSSIPYKGLKPGRRIMATIEDIELMRKSLPAIHYISPQNVADKQETPKQEQLPTSQSKPTLKVIYHEVQPGDTLWKIAQQYPGTSVDQLKRINKISNSKDLKAGSKIKVSVKG